jgi:hypothetical protein
MHQVCQRSLFVILIIKEEEESVRNIHGLSVFLTKSGREETERFFLTYIGSFIIIENGSLCHVVLVVMIKFILDWE